MNGQMTQYGGTIGEMLHTHPQESWLEPAKLAQVIHLLDECASTCTVCADACLSEKMVAELTRCIRLNQDCADICQATARVLLRVGQPERTVLQSLVQTCATVCQTCGQECASHAQMHAHCRVCAESCRRCEEACWQLLESF
jgi:uncharacterized membrane protein